MFTKPDSLNSFSSKPRSTIIKKKKKKTPSTLYMGKYQLNYKILIRHSNS